MQPLLNLIMARLSRLVGRMERLTARWRAGKLHKPRPSRPRKPRPDSDEPLPWKLTINTNNAWLIRYAPETGACYAFLEHLLNDPELIQMLQEVPHARSMLRPLYRGLNMPIPEALRPPEKPPRAPRLAPPRPRRSRAPAPPPPPLWQPPPGPDFLKSHRFR